MPERSGGRRNQSLADTVPTSQGASRLCVHDISRGPRLSWDTRLTSLDQKSKWGDTRLDDSPIAVGWSRADQTRRWGNCAEEITQAVIEMTLLRTQRSICSLETDQVIRHRLCEMALGRCVKSSHHVLPRRLDAAGVGPSHSL
jgi:hypothetical protein